MKLTKRTSGTTVIVISHHDDDLPAFVRRQCVVANGTVTTPAATALGS